MRALVLVVLVAGCGAPRLSGAPVPGTACADAGGQCASSDTLAICDGSKWSDFECPGTCDKTCDFARIQLGAACPPSFEGVGGVVCNDAGTSLIGCRDGGWAEVTCPVCVNRGGYFSCT